MKIAVVTFDGFNELDSFIALGLINRLHHLGWQAEITSPGAQVTSMNGVTVQAQQPLEFANEADVVLFGSGIHTRAIATDGTLLDRLRLDPLRQLIAGQCSGTLLMARLGLLADMPACTDSTTKPWVVEAGVRVLEEPFHARGPIATAGGCLASQYLATWVMARRAGLDAARDALRYAAPVGEKDAYVERVLGVVKPFLQAA
ncbi:DJ-1/PfpI family protein [Roseateles saccharophilus]|uniref:DJ-1/PfpI family protein n=1 Tax=Roseateles saccharophilus TaxID=304 RepID=A0A4R3VB61_ROSSA|nr:DJ-1/PfpI family protein [Roseateles saccharophilus]MDG0831567.1 AraC family transcriptional regulator [Roseateles saccharophilus]TCV01023.1 DJ-1/PfpI family protein [Roseateles saccharophilus]